MHSGLYFDTNWGETKYILIPWDTTESMAVGETNIGEFYLKYQFTGTIFTGSIVGQYW